MGGRRSAAATGGGRMWMEENLGTRINRERIQHAAEVDADVVAAA